ncbi:MAG: heat-inducible transcriptional repressor HrcA [Vicinamibacterales bacterium]|jgi:heat-inducible transcriptional repressor|nr:heat-inducible transcriptional repressor HrcA [Vicinamibacterales bacterium]
MSRQPVPPGHSGADLPERTRRLLAALIQEYIDCGAPVPSRWLAEHGGFGLSSATVRQILARLEEAGFVKQPHKSAGRVPTDLGYRCYVDLLLEHRHAARSTSAVEARLRQAGSINGVLSNVSHELSRVSHHLGFVLAPTNEVAGFEHIEFVPLEGNRILVLVTAQGQQVCHKVIDIGERVGRSELEQGANYLNREFRGLTLGEVRASVIERLRQEQVLYDELLSRSLRLASSTLEDMVPHESVFIDGATFLFDEVSDDDSTVPLATLRALLSMMEEKHRLVRLLSEYLGADGLRVVIGTEHSETDLQPFSLIASTYFDGRQTGTVGVIGPRRMRYSRAIAAVDSVSQAVSRVLVNHTPSPEDNAR